MEAVSASAVTVAYVQKARSLFSCIMGALSFELIIEAAKTIAAGDHTTALTVLNLGCIGVAITVKAFLFAYCYLLRKYPSAGVLAQDHRNDIILNSTGIILSLMGQHIAWWIDPMGGIIIALWILINWSQTAIVNIQKFIGETAPPALLNKITYIAVSHHPDILQVDTVRAYSSGVGYFCEVDIVVDPLTTVHAAHDIAESLQVVLESLEEIERAFVHIDYNVTHHPEHLV
ncbi:cation efflux protein [Rhizoclosmatium globosum]|uniref:Cation efflux protein n=1 Tax=Rhizoclosmatium globosum TaxID=329046 RepID=A0A1Y2CGC7_9FUNG|nr:cation efflux protein [Rhizoclosmatium globosum]|eukprot:ORY46101.1 cation efflux protein [Rhizoclosmatium globosum]